MYLPDWAWAILFAVFVGSAIFLARLVVKDIVEWWREER